MLVLLSLLKVDTGECGHGVFLSLRTCSCSSPRRDIFRMYYNLFVCFSGNPILQFILFC